MQFMNKLCNKQNDQYDITLDDIFCFVYTYKLQQGLSKEVDFTPLWFNELRILGDQKAKSTMSFGGFKGINC